MRYVASVVGGTLAFALLMTAAMFVAGRAAWWQGFSAAGIAAGASLLVSLAIVVPTFSRSVSTLASAFLVAGVVRAVVVGTLVVLAIKQGGYPQDPTLAIAAIFYAAIVGIEGFVLWTLAQTPNPKQNQHPTQDRA